MKRLDRKTGVLVSGILSCLIALYLTGCGDPPSTPVEQRGDIAVSAYLPNSSLADSMLIILDADTLGYYPNPDTLRGILAGLHHLEVRFDQELAPGTIVEYFQVSSVEVEPDVVVQNTLYLTAANSPAPDFTLTDIQGDTISLSALQGQVRLLYFFSST